MWLLKEGYPIETWHLAPGIAMRKSKACRYPVSLKSEATLLLIDGGLQEHMPALATLLKSARHGRLEDQVTVEMLLQFT